MSNPEYPVDKQKPLRWEMVWDVAKQYNAIMAELRYTEPKSVEAQELFERIRELPGYPLEFETMKDDGYYLKPTIVSEQRIAVH